MLRALLSGLAAFVVVACTAAGGSGGPSSAGLSAAPPDPSIGPGVSGAVALPAAIIDPIVADAAQRLSVDPAAVTVVEAVAMTFNDGSLGCPKPGEMYTQALVDGYQVIVEADGTRLDYRGSGPGQFRICDNP